MTHLEQRTAILLDRHPLWLDAVEAVLRKASVEVRGKTTVPTVALSMVDEHRPDLLVIGMQFGEGQMDGLSFLRLALERDPGLKVVVLSESEDPTHVEAAFSAGAVAYVTKSAHPDDLASAVRQAFLHSIYLANGSVHTATNGGAARSDSALLTRREREILRLVSDGRTNAELATMLWVTEQTVKFHLSNIYRKLGVSNRTEASRWAQLHGLLAMS
jgi:DNA-binding NarL/FixJ family response regulator